MSVRRRWRAGLLGRLTPYYSASSHPLDRPRIDSADRCSPQSLRMSAGPELVRRNSGVNDRETNTTIVLHGRLLSLATVLSLMFMVGTLLALVLALTAGLFGIHEVLSFKLVPTTLVVESIGTIILAVTVALVLRSPRAP